MRLWLAACLCMVCNWNSIRSETVDFRREVRPILSDKCFRCHGPDDGERATDLRLDIRHIAASKLDSGVTAIIPGDISGSELIGRITSVDPDDHMPPLESGKTLHPSEIEVLTEWIKQGAKWNDHWSFTAPTRPKLPDFLKSTNSIDAFVFAKLNENKLEPSVEATKRELVRRVTLDLTGLPPSPLEVSCFIADVSPSAYECLVDRLLQSHRFGEQQARFWLDAARYGDTHGLHLDNERSIWPYRDWVINAFNSNMPFDQFTIEQLAGDLLEDPTPDQLIATGFNRCNVTTGEGGSINEEYLVRYAVERVETTSTVWMGMTTGCAACHDHKFDPISQKEFYQFFSYFYSLTEQAMDGNALLPPPFVKVKTNVQRRQERDLQQQITSLDAELKSVREMAKDRFDRWLATASRTSTTNSIPTDTIVNATFDDESEAVSLGSKDATGVSENEVGLIVGTGAWDAGKFNSAFRFDGKTHIENSKVADFERSDPFSYGAWIYRESDDHLTLLSRMDDESAFRGYDLYVAKGNVFVHLIHQWSQNAIRVKTQRPVVQQKWQHVMMTYDGSSKASGIKIYIDGKPQDLEITHDRLTDSIRISKPFRIGRRNPGAPFIGMIDDVRVYPRELDGNEILAIIGVDPIQEILAKPKDERTSDESARLFEHYLDTYNDDYQRKQSLRKHVETQTNQLETRLPSTMIMRELESPRQAHLLNRGQYDQPREAVEPGVPTVLPAISSSGRSNRLDLAKWLVDPHHPLTARVTVNRIWQQYFGTGLVKSTEDFGSQGDWPSHPELLDWLAVELIESGWDLKHIHRLIVTSATYKQSSRSSAKQIAHDPENRLLSRGPRYRLDAEVIRDSVLFVSGLLVERLGGKSVKPYQPEGLWEAVGYTSSNTAKFKQDHGSALYRRSMYTFWKRTSPPPSMQILDAPSREVCKVRRPRTNSPTSALLMMNDVQFVEAARNFGYRIVREGGKKPADRIRFAYEAALGREPNEDEYKVVQQLYEYYLAEYQNDTDGATSLGSIGESPVAQTISLAEQAAWTMVASTILNLDEVMSKQ